MNLDIDIAKIRREFPILGRSYSADSVAKPLVYLDSAGTSQKPQCVIDAVKDFYERYNANIHRGVYRLSEESTALYEDCREAVAKFIGASKSGQVIFTRNTTEAVNLVAYSWGNSNLGPGDEIVVSEIEHHANLVPWQELCKRTGAKLKFVPLNERLVLDFEKYKEILGSGNVKLVAITGMSNSLGLIVPVKKFVEEAHKVGAKVFVDAAQMAVHSPVDVQNLDADFLAFSAHKMLGPTGVGILYIRQSIFEKLPPFMTGGGMIRSVEKFESSFAEGPGRFEAGTPNIAGVVAFRAALDFLESLGFRELGGFRFEDSEFSKTFKNPILNHEKELYDYLVSEFSKFPEVKMFLPKPNEEEKELGFGANSVISFVIVDPNSGEMVADSEKNVTGAKFPKYKMLVHPHDIASIFDSEGVCVRAGHHCCQPLMKILGVPATARISFYLYNNHEDIDRAVLALEKVLKIFR